MSAEAWFFTASYLWTNRFARRKVEAMKAHSFFSRPCRSPISRRAAVMSAVRAATEKSKTLGQS
jgi:hypothetical protein